MKYKHNIGDRICVTKLDFDEVDFEGTIGNALYDLQMNRECD